MGCLEVASPGMWVACLALSGQRLQRSLGLESPISLSLALSPKAAIVTQTPTLQPSESALNSFQLLPLAMVLENPA